MHNNDEDILLVPHLKCVLDCNDGLPNIKGVGDVTLSMKPFTVPIARILANGKGAMIVVVVGRRRPPHH